MGEAKRRAQAIAELKEKQVLWREGLTEAERLILNLAERLDERLVRGRRFSEGCYHLAFFMTHYLSLKAVEVDPIIGWVNDGTWMGMTSHAWIEFKGKKTDASLTYTTDPKAQPTGALIVHDHVLRKGMATYSYFQNDDPRVSQSIEWMRDVPQLNQVLEHKFSEHHQVMAIAEEHRVEKYLSKAPAGARYADLARIVDA
ncbi:MAG: hypothetical protein PHR30_14905 [Gallionellaceae bacterium]|nr:hypothetical protein [Gallionellaceae bacterium]